MTLNKVILIGDACTGKTYTLSKLTGAQTTAGHMYITSTNINMNSIGGQNCVYNIFDIPSNSDTVGVVGMLGSDIAIIFAGGTAVAEWQIKIAPAGIPVIHVIDTTGKTLDEIAGEVRALLP